MKNSALKVIKPDPKPDTISEIIGRDASEKLVRKPIETEDELIDFRVSGIKWLMSLMRYEGWRK